MQNVSAALLDVIENGLNGDPTVRDLICLYEFYEPTVLPTADGFDPADASQRFAQFEFTWLGLAYRRIVTSATDITKQAGKQPNTCTLTFSNADQDRFFATWAGSAQIEGMRLVVRLISESASAALTDSSVLFVGRCSEPDSIADTGTIQAKAEVGDANHEFPPELFTADDPDGRLITDPLYKGFPVVTISGLHSVPLAEPNRKYRRGDPRRYYATKQWSSYDDTPIGEAIPLILGRVQTDLIDIIFADTGTLTKRLDVIGMGEIEGLTNVRTIYPGDVGNYLSQPIDVTLHKGETGGTGTQIADPRFPGYPLFSGTAYITFHFTGSKPDRIDRGHDTVAVVLGMKVPLPDSSGAFGASGWTDNGAYHTRFLLTDSRFFGNDPAFIEDPACFATGTYNDQPLFDDSNGEAVLIPGPDVDVAGSAFHRYPSTGLYTPRRVLYGDFGSGDRPEVVEMPPGDFQDFDIEAADLVAVDRRRVRKSFTTNVILKERVKGIDFLYDVVLKSYRGYLVWNWRGKVEPRSERAADFAHLRSATLAGATSLPVEDVTPWAASLWGRVIVGAHLTTSESMKVTAFAYTADANSITLAASGTSGVTLTASGATLAGGSSGARASGTATVGGTAGAGRQLILTIQGIAVTYTLTAEDTLNTAAAMLAKYVSAHPALRRFVSAEWSSGSPTVVTIRSKWGVLTVAAMANAHAGPVSAPTGAPSFTLSVGTHPDGTYTAVYTYVTAAGESLPSPSASVAVPAGFAPTSADVRPLPAGATGVRWYLSKGPGNPELAYSGANDGAPFVLALPVSGAAAPPDYNTTGEEVIRVAMSFASNNQTADILARSGQTRSNIVARSYRYGNLGQQSSFNRVVGTYIDSSDDFAESKFELLDKPLKERMGRLVTRELNLTAVDNFHQARRLVGFEFAKLIDHAKQSTHRGHTPALLLEEGDTYSASDAVGGHVNALWRVEELSIHIADRSFQATVRRGRQYSTGMFDERVRRHQPLVPSVLRWATTLDTEFVILDLPVWREQDAEVGPHIQIAAGRAAGVGDWPGLTLYIDSGSGFVKTAAWDVEATVGEALTALPNEAFGFDPLSVLRVRLKRGATLQSVTREDIARGANRFCLKRAGQMGEIFQAMTVTPVVGSTTDFDLSNLFRGQLGTEGEADSASEQGVGSGALAHAVGDTFVVLDGAILTVPMDSRLAGQEISIKAVTVRQDEVATSATLYTWQGFSRKPLAIARVELDEATGRAPRDSAGSVLITAHPRTNFFETGDRYLAQFLSDDGSALIHQFPFAENVAGSALLISDVSASSKYASVVKNTFGAGVSGTMGTAASLQTIFSTDNVVECRLEVPASVGAGVTARAGVGVVQRSLGWRGRGDESAFFSGLAPYPSPAYLYLEASNPGGGTNLSLSAYNYGQLVFGSTGEAWVADKMLVRILFSGAEVRFSVFVEGEEWKLLGVGVLPVSFPVRAVCTVRGTGTYVRDVTLTTNPYPSTILSAAQQTEFYGALKDPVRVRIRQESAIPGLGHGLAWEGNI